MKRTLDARVAIHTLIASAINPKQAGGLFVLAVPEQSADYFWDEIAKEGREAFKAAARSVSKSHKRASIKNGATIQVLAHDTNQVEGLCDLAGVVVIGADRTDLALWITTLGEDPAGWILFS